MKNSKWIRPAEAMGEVCPTFRKDFNVKKEVRKAELEITAIGVYEAELNGKRIGDYVLAPGWTSYKTRLQYQVYDITDMLCSENMLSVTVGKGWWRGRLGWEEGMAPKEVREMPAGLLAKLSITYTDGETEIFETDETWTCAESPVRFSELYDGETYDATFVSKDFKPAEVFEHSKEILIPQQGEKITEQERFKPLGYFITPKGEMVIDFGQEVTGYVTVSLNADAGEKVEFSHAEVMDKDENFYTENYRSAKAKYTYICKDGEQRYTPKLTFYGFRYIRLDSFPKKCGIEALGEAAFLNQFTAIAVNSDFSRTGNIKTSDPLLNKLFENIIWGQKGNFLDIPTDCPQRDERLGWTGDAQAFVRVATYNFNVERFFTKWLADLAAEQGEDGLVGHVIPDILKADKSSAAWGDAATICPWQIYLTYGNLQILKNQFESMKKWVGYITKDTEKQYLWTGGTHFADWLGLDAPSGSYKGSSNEDLIASAYYAYSTKLTIKAGKVLGEDVSELETLYEKIIAAFREEFQEYKTQTEYVLAVHFELAEDLQKTADKLAKKIIADGSRLMTGFVGTPYILHVLSEYGYTELAYTLLLRKEFPSWLYPISKGATTMWEHWDGIMEDGGFWSRDMNSFNHYAYGAVGDWMYGVAAGIQTVESAPGFERILFRPHADKRINDFEASIDTKYGKARSRWSFVGDKVKYEIDTPSKATVQIKEEIYEVEPGKYVFYA